jgi:peptide/nickel transport system permease protein
MNHQVQSLKNVWSILRRSPMGLIGGLMLLIAIVVAVFAPYIAPYDPKTTVRVTLDSIYAPPQLSHPFGTDDVGKDVLTNFIYGSRVSLTVGFFASFIAVVLGGTLGIVAGYMGGRVDNVIMRFTDIMLVIPDLPLAIVLVSLTKPSLTNIIIIIGVLGWTSTARIVRSQALAVKQRKFVVRARALGAGDWHIIRRHILPLVMPLMVVNTVLVISLAILNESTLAFIGLGDPTALSWGQMLNFAFQRGAMSAGAWWALIAPGFGIVWIVLACTLLGHGMEQVLNPRSEFHHLGKDRQLSQWQPPTETSAPVAIQHAAESEILLDVRNLAVAYYPLHGEPKPALALSNVSFTLRRGESLGIVGESGCGKSTLMLTLMRLLPPGGRIINGQVKYMGRELLELSEPQMNGLRWLDISMIFQGAMNALNPVRTVGDQIAEAIIQHTPTIKRPELNKRIEELLDLVGIASSRKDDYPHQYSGGMRQRAMIAMALACSPQIVIADEPTTALDVMIQAQILDLLLSLREKLGLSIIFVTHDLGVIAELCDTVLVMYGGMVAEYASVDKVYNEPQHPYTRELLRAFPDITRPEEKLQAIPGTPPRLDALPPGCRFAPRCPVAFARCHVETPPLYQVNGEQFASCHLVEPEKQLNLRDAEKNVGAQ